jgi:hypothetical protein
MSIYGTSEISYFVTIVDDYSRHLKIYKSDAFAAIKGSNVSLQTGEQNLEQAQMGSVAAKGSAESNDHT